MRETDKQKTNWMIYKSPLQLLIIIALSIFIAEAVIMVIINTFETSYELPELYETFLNPSILVFLLSPMLFFFFFRPLLLHINERKRVEEALRESKKHLQHLSSQLLAIQEQERTRISRELHDELGQALTLLKLRVRYIEKELPRDRTVLREECENVLTYIDQTIENVRRISHDLSPMILEDCGLSAAINQMVKKFTTHHNIESSLDIGDIDHLLPQKARIIVYRIFQEILTNVGRHSGATSVYAVMKEKNGSFFFMVEDNGKGFDVNEVISGNHAAHGLGLATMEERVRMLGGSLDIWSQEGKGTRISFSVP